MDRRNDTSSYTPERVNENLRSRPFSQSHEGTNIKNEVRRHSASSASSSSSSALSESEGALSGSSSYSLSLKVKKTRKKWKKSEDVALLEVLLHYSHLLTYVEYFKPMKNFWIKVSLALKQHYAHERNARQCHDRFKVLYAKALKIDETLTDNNTIPDESNLLLLQVKDTFYIGNGNITLKSQPTTVTHSSHGSPPKTSMVPPPPADHSQHPYHTQQQQQVEDSQREYIETMHQSIFSALNNLQEQIDTLRNQLCATDQNNQELSTLLKSLLSSVQLPVVSLGPNPDDDTYNNFNITNATNLTNVGHLHPIPPSDEYPMSTLPGKRSQPGPKREQHPEK